jgi:hypothetical protein
VEVDNWVFGLHFWGAGLWEDLAQS